MTKNEFMNELERRIKKYPDHSEIISYYYELISDKMDSGMTESEAVESLGSLDDICKNIENERASLREEVRAEEITADEPKAVATTNSESIGPKRINGGKRFVYVLWVIACVFICIAGVVTMIVAISFLVASVALMVSSSIVLTTSVPIAGFQFGIGLFLFGAALVGVHYARVLVKFIFRRKNTWTSNVRKGLAGE